jgi:hypothetical protein
VDAYRQDLKARKKPVPEWVSPRTLINQHLMSQEDAKTFSGWEDAFVFKAGEAPEERQVKAITTNQAKAEAGNTRKPTR